MCGILVDANTLVTPWIQNCRPRDEVLNMVISNEDNQSVKFYVAEPDASASSLSLDWITEHRQSVAEVLNVPTVTVNTLLAKFDEDITLLSIDLEGYDAFAIYSVDFSRYRPSIIIFELWSSGKKASDIEQFLASMNYCLFWSDLKDAIFVDRRKL